MKRMMINVGEPSQRIGESIKSNFTIEDRRRLNHSPSKSEDLRVGLDSKHRSLSGNGREPSRDQKLGTVNHSQALNYGANYYNISNKNNTEVTLEPNGNSLSYQDYGSRLPIQNKDFVSF